MNAPPDMESPPALGAEGQSIAVGAIAAAMYADGRAAGKPGEAVSAWKGTGHLRPCRAAYRASSGRIWRYRGKRARVLALLATMPGGITQWHTLPWHTRLGGTVHAMRRDGLEISTELEGEYRHARYRLRTSGQMIEGSES